MYIHSAWTVAEWTIRNVNTKTSEFSVVQRNHYHEVLPLFEEFEHISVKVRVHRSEELRYKTSLPMKRLSLSK